MKHFLLIIYLFIAQASIAQKAKQVFGVDEFINMVKSFHPIAKQANLQVDKAKAELLAARGGFDPVLNYEGSRKTFDGKNYYFYNNPELKVPLPVGDIKLGAESNGGTYLGSEVSQGNSSYLGIEMPLAKGLLLDKRRASLQQAKIYRQQSEQEKLKMLNELLLDAYTAYWQWAGQYQLLDIYTRYLQVANDRLRLVRVAQQNGDRALVDTIEAFTQVQNFLLLQTEAVMKLNTAALELSNYLWTDNDTAYLLPNHLVPDVLQFNRNIPLPALEELVSKAMQQNPSLQTYNYKLDALEVERKLKQQSLLPTLNVKANLLNKDYYVLKGVNGAFLENNYKWGIDFKMPLFLREARGDYKKAQIKIKETNLELDSKRWEVENKIRNYFNEALQIQQQLQTASVTLTNYTLLLKAENLRFSNGESSLFMVNSRENKVIELQQKLAELRMKFFKANYAMQWASGMIK
jgi:outer membrane protein TolC